LNEIRFDVPATTANLGPGYGVLGLALDLCFHVTARKTEVEGWVVERPGAQRGAALDLRHDSIVRGIRAVSDRFALALPEGMAVVVGGDVPRGCGLGSNSADFAAGMGIAMRFADLWPEPSQLLDVLVELGGDPAHGAAALSGGLTVAIPEQTAADALRHRLLTYPLHVSWVFVIVAPKVELATADVHRVVPASLPHTVLSRTTARFAGLLRALEDGDEELLGACLVDETHVPYRLGLAGGLYEAIRAVTAAGAAVVSLSGHGPALLALTTDANKAARIEAAMRDAFAAAKVATVTRTCRAALRGALVREPEPGEG
jgi:homoserine kinase